MYRIFAPVVQNKNTKTEGTPRDQLVLAQDQPQGCELAFHAPFTFGGQNRIIILWVCFAQLWRSWGSWGRSTSCLQSWQQHLPATPKSQCPKISPAYWIEQGPLSERFRLAASAGRRLSARQDRKRRLGSRHRRYCFSTRERYTELLSVIMGTGS